MAEAETSGPPLPPAEVVVYCGVCHLPPEYCEYGGQRKKCAAWLEDAHPSMHARLYAADKVAAGLSELSVKVQERSAKDAAKKEAKAANSEAREAEKRAASKVTIKRIERNKRKYVTTVHGLEQFGYDIKKAAKEFGKKFATGSSVTKVPGGGEEITVQGDVSAEIEEYILDNMKDVPEDNVELTEDKKKKPAP